MIIIVGKIFRKDAYRIVDTETEEIKDVTEESIIENIDLIYNAIYKFEKLRGTEYSLKKLGFVGKEDKYIVLDRIIEDNSIVGINIISNKGKIFDVDIEEFNKLCEEDKIVNNDRRWV